MKRLLLSILCATLVAQSAQADRPLSQAQIDTVSKWAESLGYHFQKVETLHLERYGQPRDIPLYLYYRTSDASTIILAPTTVPSIETAKAEMTGSQIMYSYIVQISEASE